MKIQKKKFDMLGNVVRQKKKGSGQNKRKSLNNSKKSFNENPNHKITEYFTVRRSNRKTTRELEAEKLHSLEHLIRTGSNEKFLEVYTCKEKGRGIKALKNFDKNEYVVEYKGDTIDYKTAKQREAAYAKDCRIGSYMYFFKHRGNNYCVDATAETPYKGRLINHSALKPNLKTKVVDFGKTFHLILIAKRDVEVGEELLYDYGDRTPCTVAENPWLIKS